MFTGIPSEVDLGVLPMLWKISDPMYLLGPLLFGIATFRAGILPRWAGALLVVGAVLGPRRCTAGFRLSTSPWCMVPYGLALAWLGFALFSERREKHRNRCSTRELLHRNQVRSPEMVSSRQAVVRPLVYSNCRIFSKELKMKAITQDKGQIKVSARKTRTPWWVPAGLILLSIIPLIFGIVRLNRTGKRCRNHTSQRTLLCISLACGHSYYYRRGLRPAWRIPVREPPLAARDQMASLGWAAPAFHLDFWLDFQGCG